MPFIKLPSSITEKEAMKIALGQGYQTIVSVNRMKDGSILIDAR